MPGFEDFFGWLAAILSLSFFISPVGPFVKVFKGQLDYEDTPIYILSTSYCNCVVWYIYGVAYDMAPLKFSNIVGFTISLVLIFIYLAFEIKKYLLDAILNALILLNGTWAAYRALTNLLFDINLIGKIGFSTLSLVSIYSFYLIYRVTRLKNYRAISIDNTIMSIGSGFCWIIFGMRKECYYLAYANCLRVVISIIQAIVYIVYKKKYPTFDQIKEIATIGIESTGDEDNKKIEIDDDFENQKLQNKPVKIATNENETV